MEQPSHRPDKLRQLKMCGCWLDFYSQCHVDKNFGLFSGENKASGTIEQETENNQGEATTVSLPIFAVCHKKIAHGTSVRLLPSATSRLL